MIELLQRLIYLSLNLAGAGFCLFMLFCIWASVAEAFIAMMKEFRRKPMGFHVPEVKQSVKRPRQVSRYQAKRIRR